MVGGAEDDDMFKRQLLVSPTLIQSYNTKLMILITFLCCLIYIGTGADPGFGQGGGPSF